MRTLFIGGTRHGSTADVSEDENILYFEDQGVNGPRLAYQVRRWAGAGAPGGFDAFFLCSVVREDEFANQLADALRIAVSARA
jgi:hypothetical protein